MPPTVFERQPADPAAVSRALADTEQDVLWFDGLDRPRHDALSGQVDADLVIVGGGYTGLWAAVHAKERHPDTRVVLLEGERVGWAASGRNGGFCEASLTHGRENGLQRWPDEIDRLEKLGLENLAGLVADVESYGIDADIEATGVLAVAVEPHQIPWLRDESGERATFLDREQVRAEVNSPTYLAGLWDRSEAVLVQPAKLALGLARTAIDMGVTIFEHSLVTELNDSGHGVIVRTAAGAVRARQAILATNVFPSLLRRNKLMTVPVYDYVLATEPLSAQQLSAIGWTNRQGLTDVANQFHYYRLTADNRIVFGGYDAIYHYGKKIRPDYEDRPETYTLLAEHFLTTFPQLAGIRFTHKWAGAIDTCTRFCAFYGTARVGRVAYAAGFTGLGVGATRFGADVMLDLLAGTENERTSLRMVRKRPLPFPTEPVAALGINATRWSLDRADHNEGRRNLLLRTLDTLRLGFGS